MTGLPQAHRSTIEHPERSPPLASAHFSSSSLPSPGRPTPDKGHRKPVPSMTGNADLEESFSQRHLSEDISRYPSTISGHIGQATRDDRFAHATGPYRLVPVDEFGVKVEVPRQVKMMSNESRDQTCSSFEAFVLAPSTSSFTIYEKARAVPPPNQHQKDATGDAEGKERAVAKPSPLQNQIKVSMESRRTVTCTKQSSDTVRSGHSIVDASHSITKNSKTSWSLFSRLNTSSPPTRSSSQQENTQDFEADDTSSPTKASPRSSVSPSTRRKLRKLSVQPVSPLQVPRLSHDVSRRKGTAITADGTRNDQQMTLHETVVSSPASAKTIKSFSALHRPSVDTPIADQRSRRRVSSDVTPTKPRRQPPRTEASSIGANADHSITTFPRVPNAADLPDPPRRANSGIILVSNSQQSTLPTSRSGPPRVDTRYLDDDDLLTRTEAQEKDHGISRVSRPIDTDVQSGYWDYSIVSGIGGSPWRDYLSLLRNASMMKEFSKIADVARNQMNGAGALPQAKATAGSSSVMASHFRSNSILTAPRSSSDKSLTCSSNYPDDTDDISENSHSKYSEKRRGRHPRRRRPVSMASLAAPFGEDPLEGEVHVGSVDQERVLRDDVTEVDEECQPPLRVPSGDVLGTNIPADSSFARVRVESLAKFTRRWY